MSKYKQIYIPKRPMSIILKSVLLGFCVIGYILLAIAIIGGFFCAGCADFIQK